jgi:hypothetical protein
LSFGDTFGVSGTLTDSGDEEYGSITLPSCTIVGGAPAEWGGYGVYPWTVGSVEGTYLSVTILGGGGWSFDGFTGPNSYGTYDVGVGPFTLQSGGATGIPATWTGDLDLEDTFGTTLFEIQMTGVGTASIGGFVPVPGYFFLVSGTADVTGVGQVIYEAPSVPEPSTLTLMGIAGIASIVIMLFRKKVPVAAAAAATQN